MKGWKKIFHTNGDQKKARLAIVILDKTGLEIKTMIRDKEGYYIIKRSVQKEDITTINIYAPNLEAPQHMTNTNRHKRRK